MAYYYFISSLPMLRADAEIPLTYDRFLEMCRTALNEKKYEKLKNLTLSSRDGAFLSKWAEFYGAINQELMRQRNERLGRKSQQPEMKDEGAAKLVAAALNNPNPLAAEELLLAAEFKALDELVGVHYFDEYALIGYALKLKLLERKKSFDSSRGKAEFLRMIDGLEREIMIMEQE